MKTFSVEFESLEADEGVVDFAIRYNTKTGEYNYVIEECGVPVTLPAHVFVGILTIVQSGR